MVEVLPVLVMVAAGLVLLAVVLPATLRPLRRVRRASAALRVDTGERVAELQSMMNSRR